jgi:glycosyltransferase involved in cell wall biosynthesis
MSVRYADLVSVVIPCYNQAHFLGEAIESVLSQTYKRFEIIVVDDGSTDDTAEVAARYPAVRCIRQRNKGLSAARNSGLNASCGSFLVFLDADDRLLPEALQKGLDCLNAHPECALVYGRYVNINADASFLTPGADPRPQSEPYLELLRRNFIGTTAAAMFRRSVFSSVRGFSTELAACEDYDLYFRIVREFPICCHDTVVSEYRQHDGTISRDNELMLRASMGVRYLQWQYARGNRAYKEALKSGVQSAQAYYGKKLIAQAGSNLRAGEWRAAGRKLLTIIRYYPRGLARKLWAKLPGSRLRMMR